MNIETLWEKAAEARKSSYSPYSGYAVGAALLCGNGKIFTGTNIENAAFSATNCAERTAFFKAVSEGEIEFEAIAIAGGKADEEPSGDCTPCGVCRQVMAEFCKDSFSVIIQKNGQPKGLMLGELLPMAFRSENME